MKCYTTLSVLLLSLAFASASRDVIAPRAACVIALDDASQWPEDPPIILDMNDEFVLPEGDYNLDDRTITIAEGDSIKLACSERSFLDSSLDGAEYATARCVGDQEFGVVTPSNSDETMLDFIELGCDNQPRDASMETGQSCGPSNKGTEILLGFQTEDVFAPLISVCFDGVEDRTFYTKHDLRTQNTARDTGNDRPSFDADGYYEYDVDDAYSQDTQLITIDILTGGLGVDYVDPSSSKYLARGHYSPNSDPIYASHQDATYYFTNVGPQWQCFNAGNWLGIEDGTRDFIISYQSDLVVYTGSHGTLQLDDIDGNPVDITLHEDVLPVPQYFWKVVHDPVADTAVALVGVNNPHLSAGDVTDFIVCSSTEDNHPIISDINDTMDIVKGVVYACEVAQVGFEEIPSHLVGLPLLS